MKNQESMYWMNNSIFEIFLQDHHNYSWICKPHGISIKESAHYHFDFILFSLALQLLQDITANIKIFYFIFCT
jgi:thiamine pyrophosphokinase